VTEEEGTGIASDVVKLEGADSGYPRSPDCDQAKAGNTPRELVGV